MDPLALDPPTNFTSARLTLRCYQPDDAAAYLAMLQDNRAHLYEFLPPDLEATHTLDQAVAAIRWRQAEWQQRNLFIFGAWETASGVYTGETYLANADWHVPSIELGYFVERSQAGKGWTTEAARATLGYAFEHLGVERVDLQCRADNLASQRVAERCGFRLEGRQRLRQRKKDGELVDRLWYGLLRAEWQAARGAMGQVSKPSTYW